MNKSSSKRRIPDWYQMGLTEYILIVTPNQNVYEKVMLEKECFQDKFGADIATKTFPHITLANLLAKEQIENLLCNCLERVCELQYSFIVALKNFGGFPPHAIYIDVLYSAPFKQLINNLMTLQRILQKNDCPPLQLVNKPHMTIARRLDEETFNQAIKQYTSRTFYELFTIEKLTLLKRDSRYKKWEKAGDFYLPTEKTSFN